METNITPKTTKSVDYNDIITESFDDLNIKSNL